MGLISAYFKALKYRVNKIKEWEREYDKQKEEEKNIEEKQEQ